MGTIQCTVCLEDFQTPINCEAYMSLDLYAYVHVFVVCVCVYRVSVCPYAAVYLALVQTYQRQWMYTVTGLMLVKGTIERIWDTDSGR